MSFYDIRFSDLMKVISTRMGGPGRMIPDGLDTSDVEDMIRCVGYHFQARFSSDETEMWQVLTDWCRRNCQNWMQGWPNKIEIVQRVLNAIRGRRRDLTAMEIGKALFVTWEERCDLGLRTIRPHDLTPGQFFSAVKDRQLGMGRAREEARRRNKGVPPRAEWLAANATSRSQPWKDMDPPISRATYYRRLKAHPQNETGPCVLGGTPDSSHEPVSLPRRSETVARAGPLHGGTAIDRSSLSPGHTTGEAGGGVCNTAATARLESVAPYDALRPLGGRTDKSRTKRRANARQSAA